jgi:hypothetical protein
MRHDWTPLWILLVGCGGTRGAIPDGGAQVDATADAAPQGDVATDVSHDTGVSMNQCDEHTCSNGCCASEGICVTQLTDQVCGAGGAACIACPAGDSCNGGVCLHPQPNCGPANCQGCCQGTSFCALAGNSNQACGRNGEQCAQCDCVPQPGGGGECGGAGGGCGYPGCHGCCSGPNVCAVGLSQQACGSNGETCHPCGDGQQCAPSPSTGGVCVDAGACGPGNCTGCCQGDVCAFGNQDAACGAGGAVCANCQMYGWKCAGGSCM